ncbi:MAG: helix-turn-helix transcriptional regulator [Alphaproteobacteria bacterium]|nr:helix-turn-helix transcriptional regulator [Alphaproteobacteria bacterium]
MSPRKEKTDLNFDYLPDRIRFCAQVAGSGDALSRASGIPRRTLETYLTGKSQPNTERLLILAQAAGVNPNWLFSGKGEALPHGAAGGFADGRIHIDSKAFALPSSFKKPPQDSSSAMVPRDAVRNASFALKSWIEKEGRDMSPEIFAETVLAIVELAPEADKIDTTLVAKLMTFKDM